MIFNGKGFLEYSRTLEGKKKDMEAVRSLTITLKHVRHVRANNIPLSPPPVSGGSHCLPMLPDHILQSSVLAQDHSKSVHSAEAIVNAHDRRAEPISFWQKPLDSAARLQTADSSGIAAEKRKVEKKKKQEEEKAKQQAQQAQEDNGQDAAEGDAWNENGLEEEAEEEDEDGDWEQWETEEEG